MTRIWYRIAFLTTAAVSILSIAGCSRHAEVDDAALRAADSDSANWITYGRTYSEQRFSPLKQVDEQSVGKLGLAWSMDFPALRAYEATPLVKDGVMYTTGAWSMVWALDARTGAQLWTYDPKVAKDHAKYVCCDVVNRGVALYKGRVYLGAMDGRLIALDAKSGARVWETTTVDTSKPYSSTGAPRKRAICCFSTGCRGAARMWPSPRNTAPVARASSDCRKASLPLSNESCTSPRRNSMRLAESIS